jgi:hypothetical protein
MEPEATRQEVYDITGARALITHDIWLGEGVALKGAQQ